MGAKETIADQRKIESTSFPSETDETGRFEYDVPPGTYDVFVSAMYFGPACQKVHVEKGKKTAVEFKLLVNPATAEVKVITQPQY